MTACSVPACDRPVKARGLCQPHYRPIQGQRQGRAAEHDIDPIVVERLADGHRLDHTLPERRQAVQLLRARGVSIVKTAALVGIHPRQVSRDTVTS